MSDYAAVRDNIILHRKGYQRIMVVSAYGSIESTDSKGVNWFTIGVSPNIIDASFKALVDSLDYKLFKDKAPASL